MGKTITDNKLSMKEIDNVLPVSKGGTDATTLEDAVSKLGLISKNSINKANGVAGLNASSKITSNVESGILVGDNIVLSGPSTVPAGIYVNYTIVGYSSFKKYSVSIDRGYVSLAGNIVVVRSPNTAGNMTITLNGKSYTITVSSSASVIEQPTIVYPIDKTIGYPSKLTAISTEFSVIGTSIPFSSSTWRVSSSPAFDTPDTKTATYTNTSVKTRHQLNDLDTNKVYYLQVKYESTGGIESAWSEVCMVTTRTDNDFNYQEDSVIDSYTKSNLGKYGTNVVISQTGDVVVVSEYAATVEDSSNTGKVYLFVRENNNWSLKYTFTEPEEVSTRFFGYSVAMSYNSEFLAITAVADPLRNPNEVGKTYVYNRSGDIWSYACTLSPISREYGDNYGYSVTAENNWIIVGAPKTTVSGLDNAGMVHVYYRAANSGVVFNPHLTYTAVDKVANDYFGFDVAISKASNSFLVSAPYATRSGKAKQGVAYVYTRNGTVWSYSVTLQPSDGVAGDNFGYSLAIDVYDKYIAVGSKSAIRSGSVSGQVYMYEYTNAWNQIGIVKSDIPAICTDFGSNVSISGDGSTLVVGSIFTNRTNMIDAGIVHTYIKKENVWTFNNMLLASDETPNDHFGYSVSISHNGADIVVGAPDSIRNGQKIGTAYLFRGLN